MDDTHSPTKPASDAAAATRKRRSSILKNQRLARTPLSELEFNVATPTDTTKSRRVSFSRRTGVAEFVTNEATTTWKNFYEEHNKSLESTSNDSGELPPRHMSIGHIGKRIFDQQFEEVEIVDVGGAVIFNTVAQNFHTSLNLNITQQLASLDCQGDDLKLTVPHQNFEMSAVTNHQSKVFGDDLSVPIMPEMTNPINVNFSNLQPTNPEDKWDDLDEIAKDLKMRQGNIICPGPLKGQDMSEYIELDLNMTHGGLQHDDWEMSITDTIKNPEVQDVSKNISSIHNEKKMNKNNDWIVDKENIAVNPYITPKESKNFAINESSDKVLVFDGKKLSVKSERHIIDDQRLSKSIPQLKESIMYNDCDLSITQAINNRVDTSKRKTIVFEDSKGDISFTQAVPAKVIVNKQEKRKTIIYENNDANISMTQAVPTNIISGNNTNVEKRKTVVYEDDISFTQALPSNLIIQNVTQNKTVYYNDDADISVTQAIPQNIINILKNNCTNNNLSDINTTDAIPSNIMFAEAKPVDTAKTIICDTEEDADIEITQAVYHNLLISNKSSSEKRKTIVFDGDSGNIEITQAIPTNIIHENVEIKPENDVQKKEESTYFNKSSILSIKTEVETEVDTQSNRALDKRKTIIYNNDAADMSITQVMPSNFIVSKEVKEEVVISSNHAVLKELKADKMATFNDHDIAISMTDALPTNIIQKSENQIKQQPFSPNLEKKANTMSSNNFVDSKNQEILPEQFTENEKFHEKNLSNLSITKPIPSDILDIKQDTLNKSKVCPEQSLHVAKTEDLLLTDNLSIKQDILIYQTVEQNLSQTRMKYLESEITDSSIKVSNESLKSKGDSLINNCHPLLTYSPEKISNGKINENIVVDKNIIENQSLSTKYVTGNESKTCVNNVKNFKMKKSILNELLDMSNASLDDVVTLDTTAVQSRISANSAPNDDIIRNIEAKSSESVFVIIKDSEDEEMVASAEEISPKARDSTHHKSELIEKVVKPSPTPEYMEESEDIQYLQDKIAALKAVNENKKSPTNRHYESIVSADLYKEKENCNKHDVKEQSFRIGKKSFKNADDTRELLGMLSDFTEGADDDRENDKSKATIPLKDNMAIENTCAPKRLTFVSKRQSIVMSREDLLSNISMAQAALQQSVYDIGDEDSTAETPEPPQQIEEHEKSRRKSVRLSTEVVKTLHFEEDESVSDVSSKSDVKMSPLKKTAFGETSYMRESKARVIPSYLKDVSDNIKALMSDLVKPMADVMPSDAHELDNQLGKSLSTCSTHIQANLTTSSQIDIDVELHSNPDSIYNIKHNQSIAETQALDKELPQTLKHHVQPEPVTASMEIDSSPVIPTPHKEHPLRQLPAKGSVIVFDHSNPLNNILLAPTDCVVHKYDPIKTKDNVIPDYENTELPQVEKNKENLCEVERLSVHYNVDNHLSEQQPTLQSGDTCVVKKENTNSLISIVSKPVSIDRSTDSFPMEVKSTEVNTLIAMKVNKELLEASSSLTLVDDAIQSAHDINAGDANSEKTENKKSPLRVIYKMETDDEMLQKIDSDAMSYDEESDDVNDNMNTRKRSYSPSKRDDFNKPNTEVTPKPINKMQKMSYSPRVPINLTDRNSDDLVSNSDEVEYIPNIDKEITKNRSKDTPQKSPAKNNFKHREYTVQHSTAEYSNNTNTGPSDDAKDKNINLQGVTSSNGVEIENANSFTSSKNAREMEDAESIPKVISGIGSEASSLNWKTGLVNEASLRSVTECSSSYNVVDKINMMKYIGSRECEWESSASDVWMFRLMKSRVRLVVRLAHSHHNASRSCVRADTPLEKLSVDPVRPVSEMKDPLAAVCIRFAAEAMRYECARDGGCARAGGLLALLARCVAVARAALRWARAMVDARARLAYSITADGDFSLKVANIPLRSVWEVQLRLELVVGGAEEPAWPRAGAVRARAVLADTRPAPGVARLAAAAHQDWRHVPETVWSVFRYLKNKSKEDYHFMDL